jgi:predicted molibdopterin-dependent oxidoreductase YjgC
MNEIVIEVDGRRLTVEPGITVAAALWNAGIVEFRVSVAGEPRGPLCGMGVCQECRVEIDGRAQQRSCMYLVENGMIVKVQKNADTQGPPRSKG